MSQLTLQSPVLQGLNPEQRQAVTAPGHVRVQAGPGTGKTEVIARRYAWLWQQLSNQHPDADDLWIENQLLVVTFTQKAATEMRERITRQLEQSLARRVELTGRWVGTFHQVVQQWLLQWGYKPELLTDLQQYQLDHHLLEQIENGELSDCSAALQAYRLTGQISASCLSLDSLCGLPLPEVMPLLRDLPRLVARIQSAGLTPAAFYTAAHEQTERFTQHVMALPTCHPVTGQPFENAMEAIETWQDHLSAWASPLWQPIQPGWQSDTSADNELFKTVACLRKTLLGSKNRKTKAYDPMDPTLLIAQLREQCELEKQIISIVSAYYAVRCHRLAHHNQTDYDGLIEQVLGLWQQDAQLARQASQQFAAVIVDEFQDTNPAQCALLQPLEPRLGLMVVGDLKQSIYGFRYAEPANLQLVFTGKSPVMAVSLVHNYRSLHDILQLANGFAHHYQLDNSPPLIAHQLPQAQYPPFRQIDADEQLGNLNQQRQAEASRLIDSLRLYHQTYAWSDMAILCQQHNRAMDIFTQLTQAGIPARLQKIPGLLEQPVLLDVLAITRLLVHLALPHVEPGMQEAHAWVRLLQRQLSDRQLYVMGKTAQQQKLSWSTIIVQRRYDTTLSAWPEQLRNVLVEAAENLEPAVLYDRVVQVLERLQWLEAYGPYELQLQAFAHWQYLAESIGRQANSLKECLTPFSIWAERPNLLPDVPLSDGDAVSLLTAHSAKGLEFPVVLMAWTDSPNRLRAGTEVVTFEPQHQGMPGMGLMLQQWEGEPTLKFELCKLVWRQPRLLAEQQRLFYVALTRAKQSLELYRSSKSPAWTHLEIFSI